MLTHFHAYLIWLIAVIVIYYILTYFSVRWFAALTIALLVSFWILALTYPYKIKDGRYEPTKYDRGLAYIAVVTALVVIIYVLIKGVMDRQGSENPTIVTAKLISSDE